MQRFAAFAWPWTVPLVANLRSKNCSADKSARSAQTSPPCARSAQTQAPLARARNRLLNNNINQTTFSTQSTSKQQHNWRNRLINNNISTIINYIINRPSTFINRHQPYLTIINHHINLNQSLSLSTVITRLINHHQPSWTSINRYRPSLIAITGHRPSSTKINHNHPSSNVITHHTTSSTIINSNQPSATIPNQRQP